MAARMVNAIPTANTNRAGFVATVPLIDPSALAKHWRIAAFVVRGATLGGRLLGLGRRLRHRFLAPVPV